MPLLEHLKSQNQLIIRQRRELVELFGFESRNKYEIHSDSGAVIGFCAEQQKGLVGILLRQFLGHWRSFDLHFFDSHRQLVFIAKHPFRFFFQRLEVHSSDGRRIGTLQQRFGLLTKKFDLEDERGQILMKMRSGFFSFWTFPIIKQNSEAAVIRKKWSGLLKEAFLDADNFQIEFKSPMLSENEKALILAAGVFTDLQYFEQKGSGGPLKIFED